MTGYTRLFASPGASTGVLVEVEIPPIYEAVNLLTASMGFSGLTTGEMYVGAVDAAGHELFGRHFTYLPGNGVSIGATTLTLSFDSVTDTVQEISVSGAAASIAIGCGNMQLQGRDALVASFTASIGGGSFVDVILCFDDLSPPPPKVVKPRVRKPRKKKAK